MKSDRELLDEFARSRSEEAFRTLVDRHLDLVHSVARRVTLNDDLARDVAQAVFLKLATRPGNVPPGLKLLAWLHRTTRHKAIDLVRSENRRRRREQISSQQENIDMENADELDWKSLEPVLDGALAKLSETDRALILSRYYNKNSHAASARELSISEDAARMRTQRALKKLRSVLAKRGIVTTSALLATAVTTHAVSPAPASLAASISTASLTAAKAGGTSTFLASIKAHLVAIGIIVTSLPIIALQLKGHADLKTEALELHADVARPAAVQPTPTANKSKRSRPAIHLDLSAILAIPDPLDRLSSLLDFARSVDPDQIPLAVTELREGTPDWDPHADITAQLLFTRWAKSDLEAALHHVENQDYKVAAADMAFVLATLAAENPQRAIAWLDDPSNKHIHIPTLGHVLAGTIAREWAKTSPKAALDWAITIGENQRAGAMTGALGTIESTHAHLLDAGLQRWQALYPDEATEWQNQIH